MAQTNLLAVTRTFEWFNAVMANPDARIERDQVERHFTPDARMITNGQLKCDGIEAHLAHFRELQKKLRSFRIRLPLELTVSGEDRTAAHYLIDYVTADGHAGIVHICALWNIRDGKIAQMVETAHFEGQAVPLDNHS